MKLVFQCSIHAWEGCRLLETVVGCWKENGGRSKTCFSALMDICMRFRQEKRLKGYLKWLLWFGRCWFYIFYASAKMGRRSSTSCFGRSTSFSCTLALSCCSTCRLCPCTYSSTPHSPDFHLSLLVCTIITVHEMKWIIWIFQLLYKSVSRQLKALLILYGTHLLEIKWQPLKNLLKCCVVRNLVCFL